MLLSEQARLLAEQLHANQLDKAGKPYIHHLSFVADLLNGQADEIIATAWLHDSVEDTSISLCEIQTRFGKRIAEAVNAITKRKNEPYDHYLSRVKANSIARQVKLADLSHNMDLSRLAVVTRKDKERIAKYQKATQFLQT
ncbi:HD domain-containing protein [Rodentibacter pneumotropicus]|uniref:HD domain-containing protein n=1 Tax=Rodentibacter pneumotropicus TaxID=758 RepID=A0AAW5LC26_9PAST|nr:HD domain-containing protein [Rodentibacter heylii]MCQ9121578.1 HD domain-containing protein [Rodentibacter pneumotropicus]QIA76652.1 HD domain-containing protein [Rodentibacter heylii]